jgi:hypothetical protein
MLGECALLVRVVLMLVDIRQKSLNLLNKDCLDTRVEEQRQLYL